MTQRTFRYIREERGTYRVYYRRIETGALYCLQNEGGWGRDRFTFNLCSRDGEPECEAPMPDESSPGVGWKYPSSLAA